jgi:hypothetical protein
MDVFAIPAFGSIYYGAKNTDRYMEHLFLTCA